MQTRNAVLIVSGIAALILFIGLLPAVGVILYSGSGVEPWWPMMAAYDGWQFWLWGAVMMIGMLLFWVLIVGGIVLLVVWLVRAFGAPTGAPPPAREDPLDILKQRYARGEITREQYEQMRQDLTR